eukprot:g8745.t1
MVDQFPSPGFFGEIDIYHPTLNGGQIGVVEEPLEEVDPGNAGEAPFTDPTRTWLQANANLIHSFEALPHTSQSHTKAEKKRKKKAASAAGAGGLFSQHASR